jgi:glucose/mannose transport system substrate-binding protein
VKRDNFDSCALKSMDDMVAAADSNKLLGSVAHEIAQAGAIRGAFTDVATAHFNSDMSSEEATKKLVEAIKLAK